MKQIAVDAVTTTSSAAMASYGVAVDCSLIKQRGPVKRFLENHGIIQKRCYLAHARLLSPYRAVESSKPSSTVIPAHSSLPSRGESRNEEKGQNTASAGEGMREEKRAKGGADR
jgi:hypothetical protein